VIIGCRLAGEIYSGKLAVAEVEAESADYETEGAIN